MNKIMTIVCLAMIVLGSQRLQAQTETVHITPTDDTFKRVNSTTPEGDNVLLRNRRANTDFRFDVYVKYDLASLQGKDVQDARVRLYTETAETTDGVTFQLRRTTTDWDEETMVHENRPDEIVSLTEIFYDGTAGWYEWDITDLLVQLLADEVAELSVLSFPMSGSDTGTNVYWHSKENESGNAPFLTVEYTAADPEAPLADDIMVDGATVEGFDPEVFAYAVTLPYYQTIIPVVSATAADPDEPVEVIQAASLTGELAERTAVVNIGLPENQSSYSVVFATAQQPKAEDITIDGQTVEGFDPDITEYWVYLPYNAVDVPVVDAQADIDGATVQITQAQSLTGDQQERTAQVLIGEPGYEMIYNVVFELEDPFVASGIFIDENLINGFEQMTLNYLVELPYFADQIPVVTAEAADPELIVEVVQAVSLTGELSERTAYVRIGDGAEQFEYTIVFELVNSFAFSPTDDTYVRPNNSDINGADVILFNRRHSGEWRRDVYMKFDLSQMTGLNAGSAVVRLYTEYDLTDVTEIFELRHTEANWDETTLHGNNRPDNIAAISQIVYDGTPGWYEWDVTSLINGLIADGVTEVSLVSFPMSGSDGNRVDWHSKENPSGSGPQLVITNLDHLKATDLRLDGATVEGFNPDNRTYQLSLPYYTVTIPQLDGDAANPEATVLLEQAVALDGTPEERSARMIISDEMYQFVYTVIFELEEKPVASEIMLDDNMLDGFAADVLNYNVSLPYYAADVPVVAATATIEGALVVINQATNLTGTEEERTAEVLIGVEGYETIYTILFTLEEQPKASEILIDGALVEGFNQDVLAYEVIVPHNTTDVPVVTAAASLPDALVEVIQAQALTGAEELRTATIKVGEPGYELVYTVLFSLQDVTSIMDAEQHEIQCWYYDGRVVIENLNDQKTTYQLFALNGQLIASGVLQNQQIMVDATVVHSGVYVLTLQGVNRVFKLLIP